MKQWLLFLCYMTLVVCAISWGLLWWQSLILFGLLAVVDITSYVQGFDAMKKICDSLVEGMAKRLTRE